MPYTLMTPYQWQTWGAGNDEFTPYSRLAGRRFNGGTINGSIPISLTDVARGQTLIVNGTNVTLTATNGLCVTSLVVNSPIDCDALFGTPVASRTRRSAAQNEIP